MLYELITNKVLVVSVCAWAVTQLLKVVATLVRERRLDFRYLLASGGMPSSHSAVVGALVTSVAMLQGLSSVAFGIAAVLALIVMYDSAGVRQSVGQQSVVLIRIVQEFRFRRPIAELERDLREFLGHTPFQVIVGAIIGILIAWLWLAIPNM
ncbi:MAG TPA: divergent PAP2 family protein [Dehalococcoidales bacterium]|nr:divergent PAP2 family protein [Dehalococcoidales bacterium]